MATKGGVSLQLETRRFRDWTRAMLKEVPRSMRDVALKKIAFDFLERVIKKTPVDTGRARAGWTSYLIEKGGRDVAVSATSAPPPGGGDANPNRDAIAEGRAESSFREGRALGGPFIVLVNAVNYIVFLEFGSSGQAPAGMIRLTFREMRAGASLTEPMREALVAALKQANRTSRARVRRKRTGGLPG